MAKKDDGYLRFPCRSCGRTLKIRKTAEGGDVVSCPACGAQVNVPISNLEAIAKGSSMPETGDPGRINIDPDLLMRRLRGDDLKEKGAAARGGAPTLKDSGWSGGAAFARIVQLDQLAASLLKIEENVMGQIQRAYRQSGLDEEDREQRVKEIAERRMEEIRGLVDTHLMTLRQQILYLEPKRERLERSELERLEQSKVAREVLTNYARHVLGLQI